MLTSSLDRPRTADRFGTSYAKARGAASGNDAPNRSVRMESRRVARGSRSWRRLPSDDCPPKAFSRGKAALR